MTVNIRAATKADIDNLSRVLGRAFFEDRLMKWLLLMPTPDDAVCQRCSPGWSDTTI